MLRIEHTFFLTAPAHLNGINYPFKLPVSLFHASGPHRQSHPKHQAVQRSR